MIFATMLAMLALLDKLIQGATIAVLPEEQLWI